MKYLILALVACGPAKPAPSGPGSGSAPITNATPTCADAAAGLERGTVGLRAPDASVLQTMRKRCVDDAWPANAVACFAGMKPEDLGPCAKLLDKDLRERMFGAVVDAGNVGDADVALAIARARLAAIKLPVAECDNFVTAVAGVLDCAGMPLETRLQLGAEASDFWALPTDKLPAEAAKRMAVVCSNSLTELQRQAHVAGCMP